MPGYKGHLVGGVAAYALSMCFLYSYCSSPLVAILWLICSLAGSLFPDIDTKSKGQKYFYRCFFLIFIVLIIEKKFSALACMSLFSLLPMLVNHRGLFHRTWFIILFPLACWYSAVWCLGTMQFDLLIPVIFFIMGALSHLYLDLGVRRMVLPKKKRRWKK